MLFFSRCLYSKHEETERRFGVRRARFVAVLPKICVERCVLWQERRTVEDAIFLVDILFGRQQTRE